MRLRDIKVGMKVRISEKIDKNRYDKYDRVGWDDNMNMCIGRTGKITSVKEDYGTVKVEFKNLKESWLFYPRDIELVSVKKIKNNQAKTINEKQAKILGTYKVITVCPVSESHKTFNCTQDKTMLVDNDTFDFLTTNKLIELSSVEYHFIITAKGLSALADYKIERINR